MGTVRVERSAEAMSPAELRAWFAGQREDMAHESGTDAYCGNWNSNDGLRIIQDRTFTPQEAEAYLDQHLTKRGPVYALKIGDFSKEWPATKAQQTLVERLRALERESFEFDYRILERARKQKSKTKKCAGCDSTINVHKLPLPALRELEHATLHLAPSVLSRRGRFHMVYAVGLTDCPVCGHNLLKTDTDTKQETGLLRRLGELSKKVADEKKAHSASRQGKDAAYWMVAGDCGC